MMFVTTVTMKLIRLPQTPNIERSYASFKQIIMKTSLRGPHRHTLSLNFSKTEMPRAPCQQYSNYSGNRCQPDRSQRKPLSEVRHTYAKIRCKGQPAQIRSQCPTGDWINLGPKIGQVACDSCQQGDVDSSLDRALEPEEQWHPYQVQTKLHCVKRRAFLNVSSIEYGNRLHISRCRCYLCQVDNLGVH